jgi:hypothetical protein
MDWQDMDAMRYKAQVALNSSGKIGERAYIPIDSAIAMVIDKKMLVTRSVMPPPVVSKESAPPGSYEGFYNDSTVTKYNPDLNPNDLHRLNNLGN